MSHTCPTCARIYKNYQSYHRHKTEKHPEELNRNSAHDNYLILKPACNGCDTPLSFDKRANKFCTPSCRATHYNKLTTPATRQKRLETWRKKNGGKLRRDGNTRVYTVLHKKCETCNTPFTTNRPAKRFCNPTCNITKNGKIAYRQRCKFELNPVDHAELYDFELIRTNGWYVPANKGDYNPQGVTWDHLYPIEDGFANGVRPDIMSHPANAEMVPWTENIRRKKSTITLEELFERIREWDETH